MIRHLAAILAADIVGYSAQMGADQEGAREAPRRLTGIPECLHRVLAV
jgi:hypothetical protein